MKVKIKQWDGKDLEVFKLKNRRFCNEPIGRKDKNGKDIREGSIVIVHGKLNSGGVVVYNEGGCGFCFESENMWKDAFAHDWGESQGNFPEDSWEVVDSIYGNDKELVKMKKISIGDKIMLKDTKGLCDYPQEKRKGFLNKKATVKKIYNKKHGNVKSCIFKEIDTFFIKEDGGYFEWDISCVDSNYL